MIHYFRQDAAHRTTTAKRNAGVPAGLRHICHSSWQILVALIILYFIYDKYLVQVFSRRRKNMGAKIPDWVTNSKEKGRKK